MEIVAAEIAPKQIRAEKVWNVVNIAKKKNTFKEKLKDRLDDWVVSIFFGAETLSVAERPVK